MPVDEKTEKRTIETGKATLGAPQRMRKRSSLDYSEAPPPTLAELQARQDAMGRTRRPTKQYRDVDESTIVVPDVPPTDCD